MLTKLFEAEKFHDQQRQDPSKNWTVLELTKCCECCKDLTFPSKDKQYCVKEKKGKVSMRRSEYKMISHKEFNKEKHIQIHVAEYGIPYDCCLNSNGFITDK